MVHPFQRADIMAVEHHFAFQLVPVLLDVVVLHHDDHHVHLREELVEVADLVLHDGLLGEEGVEGLHALVNHLGQLGIVAHQEPGVDLLAELVVRGRHAHDIHVRLLILGGELDARLQSGLKQFVQSVLLKGSLARVEGYFLANFLATWRDK